LKVPKLDKTKVIPQEMKVEDEVGSKGEKENDPGTTGPLILTLWVFVRGFF